MGELRWGWMHGIGWTLFVAGGTLWLLLIATGAPPPRRRTLSLIFGALTAGGLLLVVLYYLVNRGYVPFDEVPIARLC